MSDHDAVVPADERPTLPTPVFSGDEMAQGLAAYKALQATLDQAMPDQIMEIRGKPFRKKGYWRAVRTAFNLEVHCVEERHTSMGDDWGYEVTYRATAPNGASADGDGACMASEKAEGQDTVHNVRGHAHTRAFNRAVSNLVGFGEVSWDELPDSETGAGRSSSRGGGRRRDGDDDAYWIEHAKRSGNCHECDAEFREGDRIWYDRTERKPYCQRCGARLSGEDLDGDLDDALDRDSSPSDRRG